MNRTLQPRRTVLAVIALVAALVVSAVGCSSEPDGVDTDGGSVAPTSSPDVPELDAEHREYADALSNQLDVLPDSPVSGESAHCLSARVVALLGPETIAQAGGVDAFVASADGFDFAQLGVTRAQGEEIYDAFGACGTDLASSFRAELAKVAEGNAEYASCLDDAWSPEAFRDLFVGDMTSGGAEAYAQASPDSPGAVLIQAVVACTDPR